MTVEELLRQLGDADARKRASAARRLGQSGHREAQAALIGLLGDEDWSVRVRVCQALGQVGDGRAVQPLMLRLADRNAEARQAACQALGRLGDARAVEPLLTCLADSKPEVRRAAAEALRLLGDQRAIEPLVMRLGDEDADVRSEAGRALEALGHGRLAKALIGALGGDTESQAELVKLKAEGDLRAVGPLVAALGMKSKAERQAACHALGELQDARAVEPLIARLKDEEAEVRKAACQALGELGQGGAVEALLGRLGDEDKDVRKAACEALERLGEGALARAALAAADGDTESIAELGRLAAAGDRRARQVLGTAVADSLCQSEEPAGKNACKALLKVLKPWLGEMLCTGCLVRPGKNPPACRACRRAAKLVFEVQQVVAVLDQKWSEEQTSAGGVVRGNWLVRRRLFDFDRVAILAAADEEVERFAIQVGNDTDEWRRKRYKRMVCAVARQCALSENTLRILRSTFGEVTGR
jgi:HEAT repeat protein